MAKYEEKRFNEVKEQVSALLKSVGYKPDEIAFLPGASLHGDNVVTTSENMSWYTGTT